MKTTILNILRVFSCLTFLVATAPPAYADKEPDPPYKFVYRNLELECWDPIQDMDEGPELTFKFLPIQRKAPEGSQDLSNQDCRTKDEGGDITVINNCLNGGGGIAMISKTAALCWNAGRGSRLRDVEILPSLKGCLENGNSVMADRTKVMCVATPDAVRTQVKVAIRDTAIPPPLKAVPMPSKPVPLPGGLKKVP